MRDEVARNLYAARMDDDIFRQLRQAGLSRPAVEVLGDILDRIEERLDALEEAVGITHP